MELSDWTRHRTRRFDAHAVPFTPANHETMKLSDLSILNVGEN